MKKFCVFEYAEVLYGGKSEKCKPTFPLVALSAHWLNSFLAGRTVSVHKNSSGAHLLSVPVGAVIYYAFLSTPLFLGRQPYYTDWQPPLFYGRQPYCSELTPHFLPISGQDFRHWVPNLCTGIISGTRLKNECTLARPQCTLSATSEKRC